MNIERIAASRPTLAQRTAPPIAAPVPTPSSLPSVVSRRQFVRASAGAVVAGAAIGSGILHPSVAHAFENADPVPIPGGTPLLGGGFHVWAPGADSIDAEPITITDFNGFVGLAYITGMVTRRNRKTNAVEVRPFKGADMRFMQGTYRA